MKKLKIGFVGLFVFCGAISAHALTLSDIETQVRRNVDDTATSSSLQRYSDTVIDATINEAQREIVNQTFCLQISTGYTLSAGTTYYSLPSNFLAPDNVIFTDRTGNVYKLKQLEARSNYQKNPSYEKQAGMPTNYIVRDSTTGANAEEIAYIPIPTSTSTGTVRVDYFMKATDLASDSDVPFDGNYNLYVWHDLLIYYTVSRLFLYEGNSNAAAVYTQLYMNGMALMKEKFNSKPDYAPGGGGPQ